MLFLKKVLTKRALCVEQIILAFCVSVMSWPDSTLVHYAGIRTTKNESRGMGNKMYAGCKVLVMCENFALFWCTVCVVVGSAKDHN